MQIKEYEAFTLKECLQQVRNDLGAEAVILETRKLRKGGVLGWGARDAVRLVAATGITVHSDSIPASRMPREAVVHAAVVSRTATPVTPAPDRADSGSTRDPAVRANRAASANAARGAYAADASRSTRGFMADAADVADAAPAAPPRPLPKPARVPVAAAPPAALINDLEDPDRYGRLEDAMREIRDSLAALKTEQREGQERTVTAVVSAVAPAVNMVSTLTGLSDPEAPGRFPELMERLINSGVTKKLAQELMDELPDFGAWSPEAQLPLAEVGLRDLISHRICVTGGIQLTPGRLKAVALIGPTGVGKTTTIAKLAAHFSLVEQKKVALLTVDTYRIAAVEQLKTYSQIIDIPIAVAYSQAEVGPAVEQFADFDLLLIDTAGRSQKNIMQVGELKTLLEAVGCETHLVLSAPIKEQDMLDAARRFSAARVDRVIFSKLDETSTYGTLLNVADKIGIPISYFTTGQKVPEDLEVADAAKMAGLVLIPAA